MASNIRVVLEVDNKKYIAEVKKAQDTTREFANKAVSDIEKVGLANKGLGGAAERLGNVLGGLKASLAAIGFGVIIKDSLNFAASINDLSAASGVAINRLLEFSNALVVSGGSADKLPDAIGKFNVALDNALETGGEALYKFERLGVTLLDLKSKSEQDVLRLTLERISKLSTESARTAAMMEIFGKSMRGVAPAELIANLDKLTGTQDDYARAVEKAGRLVDNLQQSQVKLFVGIINALEPIIKRFGEFVEKINSSREAMDNLVTTIKVLAAVVATTFALSAFRGLVALVGVIGRGVGAALLLTKTFDKLGKTVSLVFAVFSKFNVIARALASLAAIGFGIYTATQLFDDFGSVFKNVFSRVTETLLGFGADIIDLVFVPINGVISLLNKIPGVNIKGLDENNNLLRQLQKNLEDTRKRTEAAAQAQKKLVEAKKEEAKTTKDIADANKQTGADIEIARQIAGIRQIGEQLDINLSKTRERIRTEASVVGKSQQQIEIARAELEARNQINDSVDRLRDKLAALTPAQQKYRSTIEEEIRLIESSREARIRQITDEVRAKQQAEAQDRLSLLNLKNQIDLQNQFLTVMGASITEVEKFNQARNRGDFKNITEAEIEALQRQAEQLDINAAKYRGMAMARELQRSAEDFAKGIRDQISLDTARSESQRRVLTERIRLENELKNKLREIEDRYQRQGELTEALKTQRQQEVDAAVSGYEKIRAKSEELIIADQRRRETFEYGWNRAFDAYVESATNAAEKARTMFETFTRSLEDAIVKFVQTGKLNFRDLANTIIAEFVRIQAKQLIAGVFGGVNKSTSGGGVMGFFKSIAGLAKGGPVDANTPYIVGEQGPEMFLPKTAGQIIPNNRLGDLAASSATTVNYNISAVDAASFRQMVARDPEFLYSVTERGRQALPRR